MGDIVVGMSVGLTVPFALAAGLSRVVIAANIVANSATFATAWLIGSSLRQSSEMALDPCLMISKGNG